jgi:predicted DsbA family dithiol-disulfide isomerase
MATPTVEIWVDPLCPWAWLTSRWLLEAEAVRDFNVVTRCLSLAEVHRAANEHRDALTAGTRALRVMIAARRAGGEEAIRTVYTEIGEAHHERDQPVGDDATLAAAVVAAGLDAELVAAALADDSTLSELLDEHAAVVDRGAFGVPTLSIDGSPPFFGPIVDTRILGEDAGRLWDMVAPLLLNPDVFEIKRTRDRQPDIGRIRMRAADAAA